MTQTRPIATLRPSSSTSSLILSYNNNVDGMLSLNTKEGAEELLNALDQRNHSKQDEEEQEAELVLKTTPLPKKLMLILCIVILSEPISMTILFPFIYFMVKDFLDATNGPTNETDIGFYVGWIASSFSLAQFFTSMFWGWISDRIGRRPVILIGLLGNTITNLSFGVSHSLSWAIFSRLSCGLLNGNVAVAKSILGEITDSTNQSMGFSLFGTVWGIGMTVGPILGGFLSDPVKQYPNLFGGNVFLEKFPYFLPCACSAAFSCFGFCLGYMYLEETCKHITKRNGDYIGVTTDEEVTLDHGESSNTLLDDEEITTKTGNLIETSSIWIICGYSFLSFFNLMFDEVFSLWMVTPLIYGGLSYTSKDVGQILSIMGLVILYSQLYLYQKLSTKISRITLYRSVFPMYMILFYLVFPLISTKLIYINEEMSWVVLVIAVSVRFFANVLGFTSITILLNNSAEMRQLGFVNGCCQTSGSFFRAIGPALGGIVWSYSLSSTLPPPFDNRFVWFLLGSLALLTWIHSFFIPDISETQSDSEGLHFLD